MPIGPRVRALLGPLEIPVARLYRAIFFDVNRLVSAVREWTDAENILEVGCGEGDVTERLSRAYPQAQITGIDITPRVGRLFRGDRTRVTFHHQTIQEFAAANPARSDLVLLSDVMHHVPWDLHVPLLTAARQALRPGGRFVLKDWEQRNNLIGRLNYFSDRYLTGDQVRYGTADDFRALIQQVFGQGSIDREVRLPPWPNNLAFLIRPTSGTS